MKRRLISLLLLAALLLTGCGQNSSVPFEFRIHSEAALEALRSAATELTDEEFDAWRKNRDPQELSGSPVTRTLALRALSLLDSTGYPVPEPGVCESISFAFRPMEDTVDLIYRINGIRYRFWISPYQRETLRLWFPALRCDLDGTELRLYRGNRGLWVGELYSGGYRIQVTVMEDASREAVDFSPFTWQGGTWKE